ncbi:MAG TPA: peptidoglycan-binding protein [Bradyrhizobium sp.]|nr:peptidoglycan-binding protein [Bradyrhizobium sp.]
MFSVLCGPQPASAQPAAWPGTVATPARPAPAPRGASCHAGMSFDRFLADLKQQAAAAGVSQRALAEASPGLVYDQGIVNRDRGQRVFGQIFTEFAGRMAAISRMQQGQARIKTHAAAFARAEKEYGVPPAVIAAFWGLESDFGANMGSLPTHYFNYAVDYDGDGHRNLLRSPADVIGSTANYIANGLKWRRGEPWLQEVRVPQNLPSGFPWDQADLTIQLPRSKWAQFGVSYPDGRALPNDDLPASLLLPMGRTGPAFLAYPNFAAYTEWNNSLIYSTTAGYLATRIAGAPAMRRPGAPVVQLPFAELREMQQLLVRAGFNVGKVDGIMGQQSRTAVKTMQIKYGLPADSWPTGELLARMRGQPRAQSLPPVSSAVR